MTDLIPEGNVDRHIERTVEFAKGSDTSLKCACISAAAIIGTYDGTTQEIAKQTNRSVSTVENWGHAGKLYIALRKVDAKLARTLWRALPPSHWWLAYDIQQAGYEALYYLKNAADYGWSGRGMLAEFDKERLAGHAPLVLSRAKIAIFGLASELVKRAKDLTFDQIAAVQNVIEAFEE